MNTKFLFAEVKIYAYLYLITAPFTYLVYEAGNFGDNPLATNIFIALSLWMYIKKIRPLLNEKGTSGINILLVLLVIITILFSVKSASLSSEVVEEASLNSKLYDVESKLEDLDSKMDSLELEISSIKD